MQGLRPLHPQAGWGRGTGERGEPRARRGACPLRAGLGASRCPAGGVPGWSPAYPAFALLSCPYPQPPSPTGKGRPKLFYARGFAPCIPGGWAGRGTGEGGEPRARRGACPLRSRGRGASRCPAGGRARLVACLPCLCFTFLPLSPTPFPDGEGGTKLFLCKGLRPLHPRG